MTACTCVNLFFTPSQDYFWESADYIERDKKFKKTALGPKPQLKTRQLINAKWSSGV